MTVRGRGDLKNRISLELSQMKDRKDEDVFFPLKFASSPCVEVQCFYLTTETKPQNGNRGGWSNRSIVRTQVIQQKAQVRVHNVDGATLGILFKSLNTWHTLENHDWKLVKRLNDVALDCGVELFLNISGAWVGVPATFVVLLNKETE